MHLPPPDVTAMFTPGHSFGFAEGRRGTVAVTDPVDLGLPTGQVVACDPFTGFGPYGPGPFTVSVPPGRYPVVLSAVTVTGPGEAAPERPHRRVAGARLTVLDAPVARWELALTEGQDLAGLGEDEFFGYGVDAGTGCFVDASAVEALGDHEEETEALMGGFEAVDFDAVPVRTAAPAGAEAVAFGSGWGDGVYPTWVGRTADGDAACFVTDFFVIPDGRGDAPGPEAPEAGVAEAVGEGLEQPGPGEGS
ncbi:DUF4241 domain-containing protein [Streptomyces sp. NPDC001380]|uniref:DUF4241 domain-containing protein n=1 Tax=Streptomyces sp. NPDC001380 TaxID=3364566 RepID=UPI0036883B10